MARFLFWTVVFSIIGGVLMHFNIDLPLVSSWFGKLPGDMILTMTLKNGKVLVYFPLVSSAAIALAFTLVVNLLFAFKSR